jgi:hypothetical protein
MKKMIRSKERQAVTSPLAVALARAKQRKADQRRLIDRIKGLPAQEAEGDDPGNPNAK